MTLYSEQYGDPANPDLVLLHGWAMNSLVWQPLLAPLAEHFHLTLIDLPGLGRSHARPVPYNSATLVQALLQAAPAKAHWLGWSLGGQLALKLAAAAPQRVEKLVTIASNPCFVQRPDWPSAMTEATYQGFVDALAENPDKTLSRFIMLQTQGAEAARSSLKQLKAVLAQAQLQPPSALAPSLALLWDDERASLAALAVPTLMLFGAEDQLVPAAVAEACAAMQPALHCRTYAGAGHVPFLSHPDVLLANLLGFLQGSEA